MWAHVHLSIQCPCALLLASIKFHFTYYFCGMRDSIYWAYTYIISATLTVSVWHHADPFMELM